MVPYGNQSSSSSFLPRDDLNHYRSYVGYDSRRNDIAGTTGPYGTYGMGNSCSNPNTGNTSFFCLSGMVEPYANASSFSYNAHGGHSTFPAVPQAEPVAPRHPMFPPGTPNTWLEKSMDSVSLSYEFYVTVLPILFHSVALVKASG